MILLAIHCVPPFGGCPLILPVIAGLEVGHTQAICGRNGLELSQVQTVYGYDVKEIEIADAPMNIG